jgi:transcription-repair coupling factor (superfamily II helicase)
VVFVVRDAAELGEVKSVLRLLDGTGEKESPSSAPWIIFPPSRPEGREGGNPWPERMASIFALDQWGRESGGRGVLLAMDNFLSLWPPRDLFQTYRLRLAVGEEISRDMIVEQAVSWGYQRVSMVTGYGELSARGDILDIHTPGLPQPLRLEFFGDVLEEMRLFDVATQRSRGDLSEATLLPTAPALTTDNYLKQGRKRCAALATEGLLSSRSAREVVRRLDQGMGDIPPALYYEQPSLLKEWLPDDVLFLLSSPSDLTGMLRVPEDGPGETETGGPDSEGHGPLDPLLDGKAALSVHPIPCPWSDGRRIEFEELPLGMAPHGMDLPERTFSDFAGLLRAEGQEEPPGDRPWHTLVDCLNRWTATRRQVVLGFHSTLSRKKFLKLAEQEGILPKTVYRRDESGLFALISPLGVGADLIWDDALLLGEDVLMPRGVGHPPARTKNFAGMTSFDGLEAGDLLVHRDYGLGRFHGLSRMEVGEVANDFLLIHYADDAKLYLPVDRLGLVQRYKGPEETPPAVDRLGGVGWAKSREKARRAVERIARDLVEMYAYRKIAKGYSYGQPGDMFREFEAQFGFEETPDQARAIQAVLDDMERPEPMDRLVCGDVGFGKTEVALRAAFRAALEGKQAALLCPTTVLAEQHYQNFKARLRDFPVNVAMLSRFVSAKEQKATLQVAARGGVDILIGTHRLLSKDVDLPHLGLLILDEEQRFGVRHKERLKNLRKNVDVLALTATPIPRTLQLSLSGIRELSIIETPPEERKPVSSALVERDPALLRSVLRQELDRQGQVFWVYNRVQGLEKTMRYVQDLAPEARVGMAHGQMAERALEETMHRFWNGELDILVCTAIIESGLDFPRANTIIVDQPHLFGLGQLYQLRGRVGRSDRQAYAYFVVSSLDHLPEQTRKRLRIILEMDYLGAGFQVAMEDLRLRGSGNILGEAQSGSIARVGLDMFLEMLEEEVSRLRGEPVREDTEPELRIGFSALIPEQYIEDPNERLRCYKALSSAATAEAQVELEDEIKDRFGTWPEEFANFLEVLRLKRLLAALQVVEADIHPGKLRLAWGDRTRAVPPEQLVEWVGKRPVAARLLPPATLELRLGEKGSMRERMVDAQRELGDLLAGKATLQPESNTRTKP